MSSGFAYELSQEAISYNLQRVLPVQYKKVHLDCGYRADVVVEDKLIVKLKSVERIMGSHEAQRLTYVKLAEIETGLLINFNFTRLAKGIKRFVL